MTESITNWKHKNSCVTFFQDPSLRMEEVFEGSLVKDGVEVLYAGQADVWELEKEGAD